ncbi:hypothetical protein CTAYLR_010333 [Chrysophaeum taylorii]|uniref:DUF2470 domain-containing protein n=1 Tax=Chrysophaeum taylorii TaxID=2483200 RepID=A0AAD7UIN5_9STRA|nr:hypothetical protein CTAYLR_010333 [Chrysophaeum taylorii]
MLIFFLLFGIAGGFSPAAMELSVAERARTTADLGTSFGAALSTLCAEDAACPWTSYVDYVLDASGAPILLLRQSAEHSKNLRHHGTASVLLHPRGLDRGATCARVTIVGSVERVADETLETAFGVAHPYADALPRPEFGLFRLSPRSVSFVGGFGVRAQAVDLGEYASAAPDLVAAGATDLTNELNSPRHAEDLAVAAKHLLDVPDARQVAVVGVDKLGLDLRVTRGAGVEEYRIAYRNKPHSVEDAKSELNKLLQEAWETDQGLDWDGAYATKPRVKKYARG